jgi:type IX secretion system PorP/SprF family membrane protein
MTKRIQRNLIFIGLMLVSSITFSQDIHFTQFGNAPANINPALTGNFDGDKRFAAIYRNQWFNVPVAYNTLNFAYDMKLPHVDTRSKSGYWGLGATFRYDVAGDSRLSDGAIGAMASYNKRVGKNHWVTIGAGLAVGQRRFNPADLKFADQVGNNPNEPLTGTSEFFTTTSVVYPDLNTGINYRFQSSKKRTSLNLGAGVFHLNRPRRDFNMDGIERKLENRITPYLMTTIQIAPSFDILVNGMMNWQGPHRNPVMGAQGKIHFDQRIAREFSMQFGGAYRWNDAIIPTAQLNYKNWQVGLAYDINVSRFVNASLNNGGPEVSVIYIIKDVPPAEYCPTCPIQL